MQWHYGDCQADDSTNRIDIPSVHAMLKKTYWAAERTLEQVAASVEQSLCFGLYINGQMVGFARVVTDYVTFSWLCDVVIDESHRKKGLAKFMLECVTAHPKLKTTKILLKTRDAHGLYEKFGFIKTEAMVKAPAD